MGIIEEKIKCHWRYSQLPTILRETEVKTLEYCLRRKMLKRQGQAAKMILVKWLNNTTANAIWEFIYDLQKS